MSAFPILSLDGGGSLGVYTLGILSEVEKAIGKPLHETFRLVYGTSTGSIIASMIALGHDIETITERYFEIIPDVMRRRRASQKSERLHYHGEAIFGDKKFDSFKTNVGIVTTDLEKNSPMVFKRDVSQAHGMKASFVQGFDSKISDAVIASSAAYPIFSKKKMDTSAGPKVLVDGGFAANNPALLALTDAIEPLRIERTDIRLLTLGTGSFPLKETIAQRFSVTETITRLLGTNAATVDGLRKLLFRDVATIRIDHAFTDESLRTNFVEANIDLLRRVYELGRRSFGEREDDIMQLLDI